MWWESDGNVGVEPDPALAATNAALVSRDIDEHDHAKEFVVRARQHFGMRASPDAGVLRALERAPTYETQQNRTNRSIGC